MPNHSIPGKKEKQKGFVALFFVTTLCFLFAGFALSSTRNISVQLRSMFGFFSVEAAELDALSCVEIIRLKMFVREDVESGEYDTSDGVCQVEIDDQSFGIVSARISTEKDQIIRILEARINSETIEVEYLRWN
jgi:hypothetical protein